MEKQQDSGLVCFLIVMKFLGIPVTKEQAESLSVLENGEKTSETDIVASAKALKVKAKICRLKAEKLSDVSSPIIAKGRDGEFFIIARSEGDDFMLMRPGSRKTDIVSRSELGEIWDGTAILMTRKGIIDREAVFSFKWFIPSIWP